MGYFFPETLYIESFSFGNTSGVALSYQITIDYYNMKLKHTLLHESLSVKFKI